MIAESLDELDKLAKDCSSPNWDGYGANPIDVKSVHAVAKFLHAMPCDCPMPSFGADPDGMITMDWHRDKQHTLSVSVAPHGDLIYAGICDGERLHGVWREPTSVFCDLIRAFVTME